MRGKIFVWISVIILISLFLFQCKSKPWKPATNQPPVVKTDDSIVFKELRKLPLYHKADSFYIAEVNDSAIYYYDKTLTDPNLPKDKKINQEIFNRLGYTYVRLSHYKKSRQFLTKALMLIDEKNTDLVDANTFDYLGLLNHYQNESDSALFYLNKAYTIYFRLLGDKNLQIVRLNTQIGDVYRWIRFDYYNAEKYYYKALQIFEVQQFDKNSDQYFRLLYNLATTNRFKNDYDKALSYGFRVLQMAENIKSYERFVDLIYGIIANAYVELNDYNSAILYFNKALITSAKSDKKSYTFQAQCLNNLAYTNLQLHNYQNAISYSKRALALLEKSKGDLIELSNSFNFLGESYLKLNKLKLALYNINKCLLLRKKCLGEKNLKTSYTYVLLGRYYKNSLNYDKALSYYQLGIISGSFDFNNLQIVSNPKLGQIKDVNIIGHIEEKASILKQKFLDNKDDTSSLHMSLSCYELLDSLISFSRKSMDTEKSKLAFSINSNILYEEAIECAFLLYQVKNDYQYIRKAFQFFEKNKYLLLLEKLKMAEAGSKAGVPDSLVELERNLNSELKFAQDKLMEEQSKKGINAFQLQSMNTRIFNLMREIEKLHGVFEQQYPNYFKIKYQDVNTSLDDLQKYAIQKGTDIIQYFWGRKSIFVIGLSGNGVRFLKINNSPEFVDSLAGFIVMMHSTNFISKEKYREYVKKGNYLYERLVNPALVQTVSKKLKPHTLIIIPDGILSKLSFDALVTSLANSTKFSYKNLAYLVHQYNIEYAYSSNILLSNPTRDRRKFVNKLLGFGYSGDDHASEKRFSKNSLPWTMDEMKAVSACFRSRIYLGQNASEYNFKKNASKYDMIHLALHGSADEENESGSKLMFRTEKDTIDDGMLYANEIYNLSLKAKLVVLSACETGIGKNYQGEGVFSLSRAFAYAGCPSIIISLWKVNDKSTATLMGNFYKHLSDGEEIGKSLHSAKLEYLESSDEIGAQPVFWASFVAFGDMSSIKSTSNYIFWLVLAVILVVIGFFVYRFGMVRKIFCRH